MDFDAALLDDVSLQERLNDADDCLNADTFGAGSGPTGNWDVHEKTAEFFRLREGLSAQPPFDDPARHGGLVRANESGFFADQPEDGGLVRADESGFFSTKPEVSEADFSDVTQSLSRLLDDGNEGTSLSSREGLAQERPTRLSGLPAAAPGSSQRGIIPSIGSDWRPANTEQMQQPQDPILRMLELERAAQTSRPAIPGDSNPFQLRDSEDHLPGMPQPGRHPGDMAPFPTRSSPDMSAQHQQQRGPSVPESLLRHGMPAGVNRPPGMGRMPYMPPMPRGMRPPPLLPGMPPPQLHGPHGPQNIPGFFMRGMPPMGMERFRGHPPPIFPLPPGQDPRRPPPPGMVYPRGPFLPGHPPQGMQHWRGGPPPNQYQQRHRHVERPFVLMTDREKEWIQKIQLIQLSTSDAYLDDYYYLKFRERHADTLGARPPLALPFPAGQEYENRDPFHGRLTVFPNALGSFVSTGSVHCPRQTVDVAAPVNFKTASTPLEERRCTLQRRGVPLRTIENGYDLLLSIDDVDHKLQRNSEEHPALLAQRAKILGRLYAMLSVCEYRRRSEPGVAAQVDEVALPLLLLRKGARLIARLIPMLPSDNQRRDVAALILFNAAAVVRRDEGGQALKALLPALHPLLEACELPFLHLLLQWLLRQPAVNHRPVVVALLEFASQCGAAFLALLLVCGQKQCSCFPPPAISSWIEACKQLRKLVEPYVAALQKQSATCPKIGEVLSLLDLSGQAKVRTVTVHAS